VLFKDGDAVRARAQRLAAEQAVSAEGLERPQSRPRGTQARAAAAQAAVQAASLNQEFSVIRARIAGRIGRALVSPSNYVSAGVSQPPLRVRSRIDRPDRQLVPGQFVRPQLVTGDAQPAVLVLDKAISTDRGRRYAGRRSSTAPSRSARLHGDLRVVTAGPKTGERIVVSGLMRVHPGMTVQPRAAAMDALPAVQTAAATPASPESTP
jgi:multidrug efflux pump subunit AcrA (membrane-fusion protein)